VYRHLVSALGILGLLLASSSAQAADRNTKHAPRASLGIAVDPAASADEGGLVVREVIPDSPAAKAGMRQGDVITKVGKRQVQDFDALLNFLATHKPGDKVSFHVKRDGKEQDVTVTLGSRQAVFPGEASDRKKETAFLGVQTAPVDEFSPKLRGRFGVTEKQGAVVIDVVPNSPAAKAGLRTGDVITSLDKQPVTSPADLRQAVHQAGVGKEVNVAAKRGDQQKEFRARLEEAPVDLLNTLPVPGTGPGGLNPRTVVPGVFGSAEQVRQLQQRLDELERRVRALEQKQKAKTPGQ
jgi:S1-C subfamily serine protease